MQYVNLKIHDSVATVLLDQPDRRNALSPQMIEDLQTAFSDLHQERRVRAVVLSGAGKHFCAGIDLRVLDAISSMPQSQMHQESLNFWRRYGELLEQILLFPKPVVAAVDGMAIGTGLGLALTADLLVLSTDAQLSAEAIRRGLVDGATAALLAFRFSAATAAKMLLSCEPVSAQEAYRRGLCEQPVPSEQIWVAATELAQKCSQAPREAIQVTKRILNERIGESLLSQIMVGIADSATVCSTEAAKEGVSAFLQRRLPEWP